MHQVMICDKKMYAYHIFLESTWPEQISVYCQFSLLYVGFYKLSRLQCFFVLYLMQIEKPFCTVNNFVLCLFPLNKQYRFAYSLHRGNSIIDISEDVNQWL